MQSQREELQKMRGMWCRQVMKQEQNSLLTDPCSAVWETLGAIEKAERSSSIFCLVIGKDVLAL